MVGLGGLGETAAGCRFAELSKPKRGSDSAVCKLPRSNSAVCKTSIRSNARVQTRIAQLHPQDRHVCTRGNVL